MVELTIDPAVCDLTVGLVQAEDVHIREACDALRAYCCAVVERTVANGLRGGDARRTAVRRMLRCGGFKPAGRNKPAQEYLLRAAQQEGRLPLLGNAVDLINAISLEYGWPISLVAVSRAGTRLLIRYGAAGEGFVFNRAGQRLDVQGLICLCGRAGEAWEPLGTPVKDSMRAKLLAEDRQLLACVYVPRAGLQPDELRACLKQLGEAFVQWCGAAEYESRLLPPAPEEEGSPGGG